MIFSINLDDIPEFLRPLALASKVILYSIASIPKPPVGDLPKSTVDFRGYPVLGTLEVKSDEQRAKIIQSLKRDTEDLDHGFARCFFPRHALRAEKDGKGVDYVICFECSWIKVFVGDEVMHVVTKKDTQELLNRHLKDASRPFAP